MEPKLNQEVINTAHAHDGPIETDAVIVGAGPVGLFQVFELGLLEIKAHVIDSLAYPGGQCVELYPDKPIYDIPAVPVCTGQELTDNLLKQIEPFGATFHFGQEVTVVEKRDDGRFFVQTSKGTQFLTKTIFIAAGVGAFQPRTLKVDGLDKFDGSQVFYRSKTRWTLPVKTLSSWAAATRRSTGRWISSKTARTRPKASSWYTAATASRLHPPAWPR